MKSIVVFLSFLMVVSCKKEATSWDTDWVVPIVNDTLSFKNLENDSTLSVNTSTFYQVDLTRTLLNLGLNDIVSIPDTFVEQTFTSLFANFNVPAGFSFVNEVEEHTFTLQNVQLKKAHLTSGKIELTVFNPLATKTFFTIYLPGITKNGIPFQQDFIADGGSIASPSQTKVVLQLTDYDFDLTGQSGDSFNKLVSQLVIKSDPNGPSVVIHNTQEFKFKAFFKSLKFDYVKGYFGSKIVADTSIVNFPFLKQVTGAIDIPSPTLQIGVENGMKIGAKVMISKIENTNNQLQTVELNHPQIGSSFFIDGAIGSASNFTPSQQEIVFNSSNSNLENYIENLGEKHTVSYSVQINPWGNVNGGWNEIFPTSKIKLTLKAQMPLAVGLDGVTFSDTFNLDLTNDPNRSHVSSGKLVLDISNAFPFKSDLKLHFLDKNHLPFHLINVPAMIQSSLNGSIDPNDGMHKNQSHIEVAFPASLIEHLDKVKYVYLSTRLDTPINTTSNGQVSIPAGAFIAVKMKALFKFKTVIE